MIGKLLVRLSMEPTRFFQFSNFMELLHPFNYSIYEKSPQKRCPLRAAHRDICQKPHFPTFPTITSFADKIRVCQNWTISMLAFQCKKSVLKFKKIQFCGFPRIAALRVMRKLTNCEKGGGVSNEFKDPFPDFQSQFKTDEQKLDW